MTVGSNPGERTAPAQPAAPFSPHETPTAPLGVAPVSPAPGYSPTEPPAGTQAPVHTAMPSAGGDKCPTCATHMAADQRYCLACGHRRGDPRLPFMDAVVFMDSVKRPRSATPPPPPPRERRPRMTANSSLIAGVATLVLAIGVGVLIGRSGDSGASNASAPAPQIITVGGGKEAATASTAGGGATAGGGKGKKAKPPEKAVDSSGTSEAAAEILKPAGDVKLPPPTVQKGGKCETGAAGCENGEFTGDFFGE